MRRYDPIRNRVINGVYKHNSLESAMQLVHEAENNLDSLMQSVAELKALSKTSKLKDKIEIDSLQGNINKDKTSIKDHKACQEIDEIISANFIEDICLSLCEATTSEITSNNKMSTKMKLSQ